MNKDKKFYLHVFRLVILFFLQFFEDWDQLTWAASEFCMKTNHIFWAKNVVSFEVLELDQTCLDIDNLEACLVSVLIWKA